MSTYVISDIHGQYDAFMNMLDKIKLKDDDVLIVDGDVLDRGPKPIAVLLHIMNSKNIELLCGNHELMACLCLNFLLKDITEDSLNKFDVAKMGQLTEWQENGGGVTMKDLRNYDKERRNAIFNYLMKLKLYKELTINNKTYIIVHGGLGHFKKDKKLKEYGIYDLVWERHNYNKEYYKDKFIITGHTPTRVIDGHLDDDNIYINKNNIAIDCGCTYGGKLGCLRLDDMKEFYVKI